MAADTKIDDILGCIRNCTINRLLKSLDSQIVRNLKNDRIETRLSNSNGLWCCTLLPTILVLYSLQNKVSLLYSVVACLSFGILCYCLLFMTFLSVSCSVLRQRIYGGSPAASFVSILLVYGVLNQSLIFSIIYSTISVYSFSFLLKTTLRQFPKTFTIGEAFIVVQGIVLFLVAAVLKLLYKIGDETDDEMNFVNFINFTILSTVGIIVTALFVLEGIPTDLHTFSCIIGVAGTIGLAILHLNIGVDCIIQIACYLFLDVVKLQLFVFWCLMAITAGLVLVLRTRMSVKASTVTRKVFHLLASAVFMSGIIYDVHLMTFAAGFGFGLVIFIEACRKSKIEIISQALESAFQVYSDEKDAGTFALTPIYLYVGLACPLLLVPPHEGYQLELLSGVLSIGVGDTAASWFGAKYGFNKWADGHKSLEGTGFNIISQIAIIYALEMFNILKLRNGLLRTIIAAVISGLVEAKTDQIDNLILPLVTIIAFQITWFL